MLEKAFDARHEAPGFANATSYVFNHRDIFHVWATTIGCAGSIFMYNAFSVVQRLLGKNGLVNLYFHTPLNEVEKKDASVKI